MKILTKGKYYGSMNYEHQFDEIILSEYDYLTPKTDWHFHENPYLMYVLEGDLFDVNKRGKTNCTSGSLLLHNWQESHYNEKKSTNARGFHIEFERSWFEEKQLDISLWEGSKMLEHPNLHHLIAKLYFEFKCKDAYSNLSIELLLFQLCESIESEQIINSIDEPLWMNSLREILRQDHEKLTLSYLSTVLGVHPVHLSRAVPKYLKTTLGDYIRRQKVKKAIAFLMDAKLSLTEISYACGFSDQSHFIRLFKMYIGMTPKQYQNKIRRC